MTDHVHELFTPAIKPLHSVPKASTAPESKSNGGHQTSHLDNKTAKRDSDQHVSNLAGNSGKERKSSNNPKEVQQCKVAKDSKNKLKLSSVKGTKKGSTTRETTKASKRRQKAPESVDQKKRKTKKVTFENENTNFKKEEDEVIHEETPTFSVESNKNSRREEELNPITTALIDAYNQQNEEIIQTSSETAEDQNIQTGENGSETIEAPFNSAKGTEEIISKESKEISKKMPQKKSSSKSATKPKAKAPKKSKPVPVNKRQKDNLKTKQPAPKSKK